MIEVVIHCLKNVKGDYIEPIDYRIFPDYIMPQLFNKYFEDDENFTELEDEVIQYTITKHLGDLVMIADHFKYMAQVSIAENIRENEASENK